MTLNTAQDLNTFNFGNGWRQFPTARTKALGCWPNQLWKNKEAEMGALVITKPEAFDEFPISQVGLNHLHAAVQAGRIKQGLVVLACWRNRTLAVVATKSVQEVIDALADIPPRTGRFGEYWWVHIDFTPDDARTLPTIEEF